MKKEKVKQSAQKAVQAYIQVAGYIKSRPLWVKILAFAGFLAYFLFLE